MNYYEEELKTINFNLNPKIKLQDDMEITKWMDLNNECIVAVLEKLIPQVETVSYTSTGLVLGNLWGGGTGAYSARSLMGKTKEDILKQANDGLDGSLDSGMGFESLKGAILHIKTITRVDLNGKTFLNEIVEDEFIGDLTEEEQDFLLESAFL